MFPLEERFYSIGFILSIEYLPSNRSHLQETKWEAVGPNNRREWKKNTMVLYLSHNYSYNKRPFLNSIYWDRGMSHGVLYLHTFTTIEVYYVVGCGVEGNALFQVSHFKLRVLYSSLEVCCTYTSLSVPPHDVCQHWSTLSTTLPSSPDVDAVLPVVAVECTITLGGGIGASEFMFLESTDTTINWFLRLV